MAEDIVRQVQHALRCSGIPIGAGRMTAAASTPARRGEVSVSRARGSISVGAEGLQAATFAELFADVFQQAAREATTPSRGSDVDCRCGWRSRTRYAAARSRFPWRARSGAARALVTADSACRRSCARSATDRHAAMGARPHGVYGHCDGCNGSGRVSHAAVPDVRRHRTAAAQRRRDGACRPAWSHGDRISARDGHAGARGGPAGDLYVTWTSCRIRFSGVRAATCG
jgi:DnaJ-class molecular chaperone